MKQLKVSVIDLLYCHRIDPNTYEENMKKKTRRKKKEIVLTNIVGQLKKLWVLWQSW
jgi:aryl-alcohol dehydrogenase-like predicted oxidoreductase